MRRALTAGALLALAGASSAWTATAFTPARHASPPLLVSHGFQHLPIRLIAFVPRSEPDRGLLVNFVTGLSATTWWKDVSSAYGIPRAISEPWKTVVVTDMPVLTSHSSGSTYQDWVDGKLRKLGGARDRDGYLTVFLLFIPCAPPQSLDKLGCESHHTGKRSPTGQDALALVTTDPSGTTDTKTVPASHEFAESATDTGPGGWRLATKHQTTPWVDATPWVEKESSGVTEDGDMASGDRYYEQTPVGSFATPPVFEYSRIYSNAAARRLGDPAVPPSPYPYYDVFASGAENGWYHMRPGATEVVRLNGWSTSATGKWNVTAKVLQARNNTGWNPTCKLASTSWTGITNGKPFTLSLSTSTSSPLPSWCVVQLTSSLPASSRFANHGDDDHVWLIGFVVDRA